MLGIYNLRIMVDWGEDYLLFGLTELLPLTNRVMGKLIFFLGAKTLKLIWIFLVKVPA